MAIRSNKPDVLRKVLRASAVPVGLVGGATLSLAIWGEMTWPFLASDGMAGYNIFFFDPMMLMGLVLVSLAVCAFLHLHLQYAGLFALVAGAAVAFYGWTGYTAHPAFTKDPFDTLLLYLGFGLAGALALPATVVVDYYLSAVESGRTPWQIARSKLSTGFRGLGTRAAQSVVPVGGSAASEESSPTEMVYHMPKIIQALVLLFPIIIALAGIAAFWYFGVTLPGHLGAGAAGAP